MSFNSRLRILENIVSVVCEHEDRHAQIVEESQRHFNEMLTHVPDHLRQPLIDKYTSDTGTHNTISCFFPYPFAKWAKSMAEDYIFPTELVEFIPNPPRSIWMGHHCEDCGQTIPLFTTWQNDPDPPKQLSCFPECPACGGKTTWAAWYEKKKTESVSQKFR